MGSESVYLVVLGIGSTLHPVTVANEGLKGFPTKTNVISLVVTGG